jgi:hypothetical protein
MINGDNQGLSSGGSAVATGVALKNALDVSAPNGTTIQSQTGGIYLGASIHAQTGLLMLLAGNGQASSNANILVSSEVPTHTLTVDSGARLKMTSDGNGNVYVPKVIVSGAGNVLLGAGIKKLAGDGSGGQLMDVPGASITIGTGKIYAYSGDEILSGCIQCLNPSFIPYDSTSLTAPNVAYLRSYQRGPLVTTSSAQVLYRAAAIGGAGIGSSLPAPGGLPSQPSGTSGSTPSYPTVDSASSSSTTSSLMTPQVPSGSNSPAQSPTQSATSASAMNLASSDIVKTDSVLPTRPTVYTPNGTKVSLVRYGVGVQGMDFSLAFADHSASEACETEETGKLALASAASAPQAGCMGGQ